MKYLIAAFAVFLLPATGNAEPSTFFKTCEDIKLSDDGLSFSAKCKKKDQSINQTSIALKGIHNLDGKLSMGAGESTYQKSCDTVRLQLSPEFRLTAICKTAAGRPSNTQLPLEGFHNIDGVLTKS